MADYRRFSMGHTTARLVRLRCPRCGWSCKGMADERRYCKRCEEGRGLLSELRPDRRER